jgi:sugar/nucleoside kinase (ribokinase family)
MPRFDVITIGSATQDVFVKSAGWKERPDGSAPDGIDACIPLGSKLGIDELVFATGGGATNAAVTFSRFGLKTACFSRVGNDETGDSIIRQLKSERIETNGIQRDTDRTTGYSIILVSGEGYRGILTHRGAASHLDAKQFPWHRSGKIVNRPYKAKWIYLTSIGGDVKTLKSIFDHAKKMGARVAWNPGNAELELGRKKLLPFLKATDVLLVNREEAAMLAHVAPRFLEDAMKKLGELPRQALVITDGKNGAYVRTHGATLYSPALRGKRLNTTGAGDAFGSAFVGALAKGHYMDDALRAGLLNAHGVVTHMGAKAGILKKFPL